MILLLIGLLILLVIIKLKKWNVLTSSRRKNGLRKYSVSCLRYYVTLTYVHYIELPTLSPGSPLLLLQRRGSVSCLMGMLRYAIQCSCLLALCWDLFELFIHQDWG